MTITVYTLPACIQCEFTKKLFDKAGATYAVVDLADDPRSRAQLADLGYTTAPVVVVADSDSDDLTHWAGFQPDRIRAAAEKLRTRAA
ncbi:MAG: NrdH-redoxin [Nocardia sp.]|nr:NrdH-redoxin [Nocardia sp.]